MIALEPNAEKWIRLESVDSTNSFLLREDLPSGTIVIADRQTQGRGRHGRQWVSPEGSLILSGILCFDSEQISDDRLTLLPLLAGVALLRAFQKMNPSVNLGIKEPNDIIIDRNARKGKVAGILVESEIKGRERRVIVGVGVNATSAPETSDSVYQPAALFDVSQGEGPFDRDECARLFVMELNARASQIESATPAFLGEVAQYRVGS
jgi:BirA family biotin operon repressor/biotin-[acetyl-CoA-carboxylase] ligase